MSTVDSNKQKANSDTVSVEDRARMLKLHNEIAGHVTEIGQIIAKNVGANFNKISTFRFFENPQGEGFSMQVDGGDPICYEYRDPPGICIQVDCNELGPNPWSQ